MTKRELINICLELDGAYEDYPFDVLTDAPSAWAVIRHKGNKKGFAHIYGSSDRPVINLKLPPHEADFLRREFEDISPAYHMNKEHWSGVDPSGYVPCELLRDLIKKSYVLTMPKMRNASVFKIRQEVKSDYKKVYELVKKAFLTAAYSDGTEADYLNELRTKPTFIPELSFVAESGGGEIVGQIVLYRTFIYTDCGAVRALVLSPLSVHPDCFRRGIARMLVNHALGRAAAMGHTAVFLCGDPEIYKKLGFKPSFEFGICHKDDPKAEWCMAKELSAHSLSNVRGTIDIV